MPYLIIAGELTSRTTRIYGADALREERISAFKALMTRLNIQVYPNGNIKMPGTYDHYQLEAVGEEEEDPLKVITLTKRAPLQVLNAARLAGFRVIAMSGNVRDDGVSSCMWTVQFGDEILHPEPETS